MCCSTSFFEPNEAHHIEPVLITTTFIQPERDVWVLVPTVNSLLGDKLTAFAPKTIGILYHPLRRTDIAKQLFDVAALFDAATDLSTASKVYAAIQARQLFYRQATFSMAETLNDSIEAGFQYSQLDLKGGANTEAGLFLKSGITALQNHLISQPFRRDEARIAAGKVACLAAWIQCPPVGIGIEQLRFQPERSADLRDLQIDEPWKPLNRLKGGNPEAFHYWYQAQQILMAMLTQPQKNV